MNDTLLYHNPSCSKSRAALQLLRDRGVEPTLVPYLETPPTVEALRELIGMLGVAPRQLLRTGEAEFAELDLGSEATTDEDMLEAMAAHPRLIERPIFVRGGRAVIGRPPERVLELL